MCKIGIKSIRKSSIYLAVDFSFYIITNINLAQYHQKCDAFIDKRDKNIHLECSSSRYIKKPGVWGERYVNIFQSFHDYTNLLKTDTKLKESQKNQQKEQISHPKI